MDQEAEKTKQRQDSRKVRIEAILTLIGGLEESIRIAYEQNDREFVKKLKELKLEWYKKLKRVIYGRKEDEPLPTEE